MSTITGVTCDAPEAPQNGFIQIKNFTGSYGWGTTALFECNQGYELIGETSRYINVRNIIV